MTEHKCPYCGNILEKNSKICVYCESEVNGAGFEITDLPKDEEKNQISKYLKRILVILIILGPLGFIIGWSLVGAFGFLFLPFLFWEQIGEAIRNMIKKE